MRAKASLYRFRDICGVAGRHLVLHVLHRRLARWPKLARRIPGENLPGPKRFRTVLEEIGGTFIKFGQMLAMQSDMLPLEYCTALFSLFDQVPQEGAAAFVAPASDGASLAVARQVAQQGTVLLKNEGSVLPLAGSGKRIAVIGEPASPGGAALDNQGWGSGHVPLTGVQHGVVSPLESISARAVRSI